MDWELISTQVLQHVDECLPRVSPANDHARQAEQSRTVTPSIATANQAQTSNLWHGGEARRYTLGFSHGLVAADDEGSTRQTADASPFAAAGARSDNPRLGGVDLTDSMGVLRMDAIVDTFQQQQVLINHALRTHQQEITRGVNEVRVVLRRIEQVEGQAGTHDQALGNLSILSTRAEGMMAALQCRQDQLEVKTSDVRDSLAVLDRRCSSAESSLHGAVDHGQVMTAIRSSLDPLREQIAERITSLERSVNSTAGADDRRHSSKISQAQSLAAAMDSRLKDERETLQEMVSKSIAALKAELTTWMDGLVETDRRKQENFTTTIQRKVDSIVREMNDMQGVGARHYLDMQNCANKMGELDSRTQRSLLEAETTVVEEIARVRRELQDAEASAQRRIEEVRNADVRRTEEVLGELKREREIRAEERRETWKDVSGIRLSVSDIEARHGRMDECLWRLEGAMGSAIEVHSQTRDTVGSMEAKLKILQLEIQAIHGATERILRQFCMSADTKTEPCVSSNSQPSTLQQLSLAPRPENCMPSTPPPPSRIVRTESIIPRVVESSQPEKNSECDRGEAETQKSTLAAVMGGSARPDTGFGADNTTGLERRADSRYKTLHMQTRVPQSEVKTPGQVQQEDFTKVERDHDRISASSREGISTVGTGSSFRRVMGSTTSGDDVSGESREPPTPVSSVPAPTASAEDCHKGTAVTVQSTNGPIGRSPLFPQKQRDGKEPHTEVEKPEASTIVSTCTPGTASATIEEAQNIPFEAGASRSSNTGKADVDTRHNYPRSILITSATSAIKSTSVSTVIVPVDPILVKESSDDFGFTQTKVESVASTPDSSANPYGEGTKGGTRKEKPDTDVSFGASGSARYTCHGKRSESSAPVGPLASDTSNSFSEDESESEVEVDGIVKARSRGGVTVKDSRDTGVREAQENYSTSGKARSTLPISNVTQPDVVSRNEGRGSSISSTACRSSNTHKGPPPTTPTAMVSTTLTRRASPARSGFSAPIPVSARDRAASKDAGVLTAQCEFCLRRYVRTAMSNHLQVCELRLVRCPFQCGVKVLVRNLDKHQKTCPSRTTTLGGDEGASSSYDNDTSKKPNVCAVGSSTDTGKAPRNWISSPSRGRGPPLPPPPLSPPQSAETTESSVGPQDLSDAPPIDPTHHAAGLGDNTLRTVTCMRCKESLPFHLVPAHGSKCKGALNDRSGSTQTGHGQGTPPVVGPRGSSAAATVAGKAPSMFSPPLSSRLPASSLSEKAGDGMSVLSPSMFRTNPRDVANDGPLKREDRVPSSQFPVPPRSSSPYSTAAMGPTEHSRVVGESMKTSLTPEVRVPLSPPRPKKTRAWSTRQVTSWLRETMRPPKADVISRFHDSGIDGAALLELTDRDLLHPTEGLGVTDADTRRQILEAIDSLLV